MDRELTAENRFDHKRLEHDRVIFDDDRVAKALYKENRNGVRKQRRNVIVNRCRLAGHQIWGVAGTTLAGKRPTSNTRRRMIAACIRRDGDRCYYCQRKFGAELLPTLDHIIPRSKNGKNTIANFRAACHACNQFRKNRNDVLHKGALRSMMAKRYRRTVEVEA